MRDRKSRLVSLSSLASICAAAACLLTGSNAPAQQFPSDTVGQRPAGQEPISRAPFESDRLPTPMRERLRHARERERQHRIVEDATRLVAITEQYRAAVAEHATPTPQDEKMLVEIEKLSRDLKTLMRGF